MGKRFGPSGAAKCRLSFCYHGDEARAPFEQKIMVARELLGALGGELPFLRLEATKTIRQMWDQDRFRMAVRSVHWWDFEADDWERNPTLYPMPLPITVGVPSDDPMPPPLSPIWPDHFLSHPWRSHA